MGKTITIRLDRKDALELGLLVCICGWPENNHYSFERRKCAHNSNCQGFKEVAKRGKMIRPRPRKKK